MVKQDPINRLLDLIRPHRSGYILSILLAVLGVSTRIAKILSFFDLLYPVKIWFSARLHELPNFMY